MQEHLPFWQQHKKFLLGVSLTLFWAGAILLLNLNSEDFRADILDVERPAPFDGTSLPVREVPDWVSLSAAERELTAEVIPPEKKIPLPNYDPALFGASVAALDFRADPGLVNTLTTFAVPYMGSYQLGSKEGDGSHLAVDIRVPIGTEVFTVANGRVVKVASRSAGFGAHIVIEHPNVPLLDKNKTVTLYSSYSHLGEINVRKNQVVKRGEKIGRSGNSGFSTTPHLHFQIDRDLVAWHPWWPFSSAEARAAGLNFSQGVSAALNQEAAFQNTVNPMLWVQRYLASAGNEFPEGTHAAGKEGDRLPGSPNSNEGSQTGATPGSSNSNEGSQTGATPGSPNSNEGSQAGATPDSPNSSEGSQAGATPGSPNSGEGSQAGATPGSPNSSEGSQAGATPGSPNSGEGSQAGATPDSPNSGEGSQTGATPDSPNSGEGSQQNLVAAAKEPEAVQIAYEFLGAEFAFVNNAAEVKLTARPIPLEPVELVVSGSAQLGKQVLQPADFVEGVATIKVKNAVAERVRLKVANLKHEINFIEEIQSLAQFCLEVPKPFLSNTENPIIVQACDAEGQPTPTSKIMGEVQLSTSTNLGTFTPAALTSRDFEQGKATVQLNYPALKQFKLKAQEGVILGESAWLKPQPFTDVRAGQPKAQAINYLKQTGVVGGNPDGTFAPKVQINRAAFTKILLEAKFAEELPAFKAQLRQSCFPDVSLTAWFAPYLCLAKEKGILGGYADGTVGPAKEINFAEAAKILTGVFGVEVEVAPEGTAWFKPYLEFLAAKEILPEDYSGGPQQPVTRGQFAEMAYRMLTNLN